MMKVGSISPSLAIAGSSGQSEADHPTVPRGKGVGTHISAHEIARTR